MDDNKKKKLAKMVDAYRKQESNGNPVVLKNKRRESKDGSKVVTKTKTYDPETGKTDVIKTKFKGSTSMYGADNESKMQSSKSKVKVKEYMDGKKIYQGRERTDMYSDNDYSSIMTTSREKKPDGIINKRYSFTENEKNRSENWGTKKNPDMSPEYETKSTNSRSVLKTPLGVSKTTTEKKSEGMDYNFKSGKWEKTPASEKTTNKFRFRNNKKG